MWPREHGAWGLVAAPLLLGTAVALRAGGTRWTAWVAMLATILSFFLLRTPLESLLGLGTVRATGDAEISAARTRALLWGLAAMIGTLFISVFLRAETFAAFALIAALAYATQWLLPKPKAQLVISFGFAAGAPAVYIALAGRTDALAITLGVLAAVLAANQVAYVQLEINALKAGARSARLHFGWAFLLFQIATIFALVWALGGHRLAWPAVVGFVPLLARGFWHFMRAAKRIPLKRLGFTEIAYTAFAVAWIAAGVTL